MTHPHDPPRQWSRPVEEVGLSLRDLFMETVEQAAGKPFQDTGVTVPANAVWEAYARRAITRMIDLGFVLPSVFEAMKAEKEAK